MKITQLDVIKSGSPYVSKIKLAEMCGKSTNTIQSRLLEFQEEIEKGRYSKMAYIKDEKTILVNYLAFIDFMANRKYLREKNLREHVPPFNPGELAKEIGWYQRVAI